MLYDIENLIEQSVRMIDKSSISPSEKRIAIYNCYQIQDDFDCSFTKFRVLDILLKQEHLQSFEVSQFPIYSDYPDFFTALLERENQWIHKNPTQGWSAENPAIAYWDKNSQMIYAEFGSPYYQLHPDEQAIRKDVFALGKQIIQEAGKQNHKHLVYRWAAFITFFLMEMYAVEYTFDEWKSKYFSAIKAVFQQFDFTDYQPESELLDLKNSEAEAYISNTQKQLIDFILNE